MLHRSEALLKMGAHVTSTDLEELLPHLEYNLSLNAEGSLILHGNQ